MTAIFRRLLPIAALLALLAAPAVAQTVTYTIVSDSLEKTFEEPMFVELEKITGVRLEPRLFPEDDIPNHYALMAAADDLPDLAARLPGNLSLQLGLEGLLMGLRGLEEYRPNFVNTIERYKFDFDTFLARVGTADGDYFVSPTLGGWYKNIKNAIIYRSDIFAEHGIEVPTTSEELADVLKQLKELYPDSIPYMTFRDWWWPFFVMFGVYDYPQGEDYYHQTAYQDALRYIADLYEAGAVDQEFPTRQYAEWNKALNEEASTFMEGTHGYSFHGNAYTLLGIDPNEELPAAGADPFGPAGQLVMDKLNAKFAFMSIPTHGSAKRVSPPSSNVNPFGIGFNANIEMPEVAAKWLDFFYSEYGAAWTGLSSPEGVKWVNTNAAAGDVMWPSFGDATVERRPATAEELEASYSTYERALLLFRRFNHDFPTLPQVMEHSGQTAVRRIDVFAMDDSQKEREATLVAQINPVVQEWEDNFILGRRNVDDDWGDYLAALDRAGLQELLALRADTLKRADSHIIEPVPNKDGRSTLAP
jgi:putative aldouronate transport system substrate-binding protein